MVGKATPQRPARLEAVMAALGLVLTLALIGVIARDAFRPPEPAELEARLIAIRPVRSGWVAEVAVSNAGSAAAAQVEIEARSGDRTASATLDYVAGGGRERAFLRFPADPRADLELSVRGWSDP